MRQTPEYEMRTGIRVSNVFFWIMSMSLYHIMCIFSFYSVKSGKKSNGNE